MQQIFACINSVPLKRRNFMVDLHQRIEMKMMTDSFLTTKSKKFPKHQQGNVSHTTGFLKT